MLIKKHPYVHSYLSLMNIGVIDFGSTGQKLEQGTSFECHTDMSHFSDNWPLVGIQPLCAEAPAGLNCKVHDNWLGLAHGLG